MKITLDTNCLIDLYENTGEVEALLRLVRAHTAGRVTLRVPGISASEKKRSGGYPASFNPFLEKLDEAGLGTAEVLKPIALLDMTFFNESVFADSGMVELETKIQKILFPSLPARWVDYCSLKGLNPNTAPIDPKWRNAKCDVIAMWTHIHYGGDVFVTMDRNFRKPSKTAQLLELKAGAIETPSDTVSMIYSPNE